MAANDWTQRRWARRRFLAGAGALGGAAFLAACGGGDKEEATQATQAPSNGGSPAAGARATPLTRQLSTVKLGGMIARTGALANVGRPQGDGSNAFAVTFDAPAGTYAYACVLHGDFGHAGTVTVVE